MIDHLSITVSNYDESRRFYESALSSIGYRLVMEHPISGAGFGADGKPSFWIRRGVVAKGTHVAFTAANRVAVDRFHSAAISAGGADNGAPGLRPEYHPTYYGAFVLDPDGYNVEAVCHVPE